MALRTRILLGAALLLAPTAAQAGWSEYTSNISCLLYTSDAADG